MGRAGRKRGLSDPAVLDGKAVAQQIKGNPGITGLYPLSVHSGEEVWHLNTSGCWGRDSLPTNRLITANPKQGIDNRQLQTDNCQLKKVTCMATPWEVAIIHQKMVDPVTTEPKGEAWTSICNCQCVDPGNTPTPVIASQIMGAKPHDERSDSWGWEAP